MRVHNYNLQSVVRQRRRKAVNFATRRPLSRGELVRVLVQRRRSQVGVAPVEAVVVSVHGPAEIPGPAHVLVVAVHGVVVVQDVVRVVHGAVIADFRRVRLPDGAQPRADDVGRDQVRRGALRYALVSVVRGQVVGEVVGVLVGRGHLRVDVIWNKCVA